MQAGLADPRSSGCAKGLTLDERLRASATLDHENTARRMAGRLSGKDRAAGPPPSGALRPRNLRGFVFVDSAPPLDRARSPLAQASE
jgi:hypothetical protein